MAFTSISSDTGLSQPTGVPLAVSQGGTGVSTPATGTILQLVPYTDVGSNTSSTSLVNLSASTCSITPKSTNSRIIILFTMQAVQSSVASTNYYAILQINEGATQRGPAIYINATNGAGGIGIYSSVILEENIPNLALTIRSFQIYGYVSVAGGNIAISSIRGYAMEVQA
jgi:hypothetical protein